MQDLVSQLDKPQFPMSRKKDQDPFSQEDPNRLPAEREPDSDIPAENDPPTHVPRDREPPMTQEDQLNPSKNPMGVLSWLNRGVLWI
jgi:hypothetical protein